MARIKMTTGLFIGRFQPFHKGHLSAVKQILKETDKVIIGIGSSQYNNTKENPFSAEEREEMIKKALDAEDIINYEIIYIPDIHNDRKWADHVESLCPEFSVVYTSSDWTKRCFENKRYPVKPVKIVVDINATEIRKRILENGNWKELVPKEVVEEIVRINGVERIKEIKD